jgi:hypothetical protein
MKFIKLSNLIINTSKISTIKISDTQYLIKMDKINLDGSFFFGSGFLSNNYNEIKVCKNKDKKDYDIIKDYINTIDYNCKSHL